MNLIILNGFEMFSLEHFITLGVILVIALALFVTRKFFIKYKWLDLTFRFVLAGIIIGSEIGLRTMNPPDSFARNMPIPLCGHLLWIAGLALLSNSSRIYKRIFPLCCTGALLSMIVVAGIPHFPEFRAWQYFMVHGGFLLGALYFIFTRKINKFTFKDYGWSCLLLLSMGGLMSIFTMLGVRDDYMAINPDPAIAFIKDALGQLGYTIAYMCSICAIMGIISTIAWLCTRKRSDEDENIPTFKENKFLTYMSHHYHKTARWVTVVTITGIFAYLLVVQDITKDIWLAWVLTAILILAFAVIIFNEVLYNYERKPVQE